MHIRRFEAPTMLEAVRAVKNALGPDALVLQTRRVRRDRGLLGLFGRSVYELTAAVDRDVRRGTPGGALPPGCDDDEADGIEASGSWFRDERSSDVLLPGRESWNGELGASKDDCRRPDRSWDELRMVRALLDPMERELSQLRRLVETLARPAGATEALAVEVAALRRAVGRAGARGDVSGIHAAGDALLARGAMGLSPEVAATLLDEARTFADSGSPPLGAFRSALLRRLDSRLTPPREDGGPSVRMLVGATGVGKTTTLAKLAARGELGANGVAVVTTDGFRVGADAQLRTYADLLGVPFAMATTADDLVRQIDRFGRRRIWIDTAGRAPGDQAGLAELLRCREALGRRAHVDLVLSATTRQDDLRSEISRHRALRPDGLIVTKLDETTAPAGVVELALDDTLPPLRWLGTGQRVPEDLRVPDPAGLAERLLGAAA